MSIHAAFIRLSARFTRSGAARDYWAPTPRASTTEAAGHAHRWTGRNWILAAAFGCAMLMSCSRTHGVFDGAPLYSGVTEQNVPSVVECIAERWKRSTRKLHRSRSGESVRLQGETFFRGVAVGVTVVRAMGRTRVQFFQERSTDHIYMSFVKGCLR